MLQLELYRDAETIILERKIDETNESLTKVRKGTYARLNKLEKMLTDFRDEMEVYKRNICQKT